MFAARASLLQRSVAKRAVSNTRLLSSLPTTSVPVTNVPPREDVNPNIDDSEKNSVQLHVEKMREEDPLAVWTSGEVIPDPTLPENPAEIATLDAISHTDPKNWIHGEKRTVRITQMRKNFSQQPSTIEEQWLISFEHDGASGETWENPLMGWVSGADPLASNMLMQMKFKSAKEAVYFAKNRGWAYEVDEPIMRRPRSDGAQYQDNFLPQDIALKVRQEKHKCAVWERQESGCSHYFRPLKYHGDGTVPQYGPNGTAKIAKDVEGMYKMR